MKDESSGPLYNRRKILQLGACVALASALPWRALRAETP